MSIQSIANAPAYIIYVGRCPGVYNNWIDVEKQIKDFPLAWYRPFNSLKEASNTYRIWRRSQMLPIRQLLTNDASCSSSSLNNKRKVKKNRKACIQWCAEINKNHSVELVRAVVAIAKKSAEPLTVCSLNHAFEYFQERPPWD